MSQNFIIHKLLILLVLLYSSYAVAQNEMQYISCGSSFQIGYIDRSVVDSEVETYDIVIVENTNSDTINICSNIPYVDSNAVKQISQHLLFISYENLVSYNIETTAYDTIFHNIDGLNINAFYVLPSKYIVIASVDYKSEDLIFTILNANSNTILGKCISHEENIGLEYLRISIRETSTGDVDVFTNQYNYRVSISENTCERIN